LLGGESDGGLVAGDFYFRRPFDRAPDAVGRNGVIDPDIHGDYLEG